MTESHVVGTTSADSPPSGASGTPSTSSRRDGDLFEPRSVFGAIGVVAVLCLLGFGIAAVDEWVKKSSGFAVGTAHQVSETVSFTPAPGWEIDPQGTTPGSVVTATKNGVTLKVIGALTLPPEQTFEAFAKIFHDSDKQSGTYTTVTAMRPFATTSGANGVNWDAHGATDASETWIVANGKSLAKMSANGSASNSASVAPDLEAMAKSITVSPPSGSTTP